MGPERTVDMASIPQPTIKVCTGYNNIENRAEISKKVITQQKKNENSKI